jgi:hypothetical protein
MADIRLWVYAPGLVLLAILVKINLMVHKYLQRDRAALWKTSFTLKVCQPAVLPC